MSRDPASVRWSQLRLGTTAIAVIVLVCSVVFSLDLVLRELSEGPEIVVAAYEARDLRPGAAVWIAGVPAGRVTRVGFEEPAGDRVGRVVIRTSVRDDAADLLQADASARIRSSSLLAPPVLDLRPGDAAGAFDPADTLVADPPLGREDLMARMDDLEARLERLAPDARRLVARLEDGPGTLASLRRDPAVVEALGDAAAGLERLARSDGTLGRLAGDPTLTERMIRVRDRLAGLGGPGGTPAGDSWSALVADVSALRVLADTVSARIEAGRGSAGRFLTDTELAEEMAAIRIRMDSVRSELLGDPFQWLRFRIF